MNKFAGLKRRFVRELAWLSFVLAVGAWIILGASQCAAPARVDIPESTAVEAQWNQGYTKIYRMRADESTVCYVAYGTSYNAIAMSCLSSRQPLGTLP